MSKAELVIGETLEIELMEDVPRFIRVYFDPERDGWVIGRREGQEWPQAAFVAAAPPETLLWQVKGPAFTAGLVTRGGIVIEAAPILRWGLRERAEKVFNWCKRKGFTVERVGDKA